MEEENSQVQVLHLDMFWAVPREHDVNIYDLRSKEVVVIIGTLVLEKQVRLHFKNNSYKIYDKWDTTSGILGELFLESCSVVMFDEAQDKTLPTDILCSLLKDIAHYRPDLKLLLSSAPMNAKKLTNYFGHAPVYKIPNRRFLVEICHTKAPKAKYLDATTLATLQIYLTEEGIC
ncbi:Pre-mRNA-splicing factor ATP-dependent RNA helicase DEAH1 [Camellia lanceoleosa]|uniref:Pre-mRNA-splicing factor ATP-dependent RNA helicase DEAH1 n=1 Tax=Camellia lanceoleosa TaxID=1840588 RepID=A0ACC0IWR1_9ERIC|nr:Pre-mRNA-splicing factor ATP-dependent RNA helicase DEAH1 [Camellia lanceoleosa]